MARYYPLSWIIAGRVPDDEYVTRFALEHKGHKCSVNYHEQISGESALASSGISFADEPNVNLRVSTVDVIEEN